MMNNPNYGNGVNPTLLPLSSAQFSALSPQDQQAVLRGLSPQGQQQYRAWVARDMQINNNRMFMRMSREKTAYCPVTGGSGVTAAYSAGTTLYFDFPTVPGFAKQILIHYNLAVTPASGAGATYAVNPAAPFSIFSELQVLYNGPQIRTHPFFLSILDQSTRFHGSPQNRVIAGNNDSTTAAFLVGTTPITVGSANTWQGTLILRLNPLGEDTVPGLLPVAGTGNKPQLKLTCAPNFLGLDPLINPIAPTGNGSGWATTVTGNINVDMVIVDGTTMDNPTPLSLAWQNESTIQYYWDTALTPFNASVIQRQTIASKLKHWYVVSLVIDGQQASAFSTWNNFTGFQIGPDQVGQQSFASWNIANNVSIFDYMEREVRAPLGQDFAPGVIPWVLGPSRGIIDADNRNGMQWLNMYPGGYPATTHSYQMVAVGGQAAVGSFAAPTPRVETFLVSENAAGLKVA